MLGTDYPFPLGELQPGALIESMDEFDDTLKVTSFISFFQMQLPLSQNDCVTLCQTTKTHEQY